MQGGNLYIESVELGTNLQGTPLMNLLGIKLDSPGSDDEIDKLFATQNELFGGMTFLYSGGESPHYKVDRLSSDFAEELFFCEQDYGRIFLMEDGDGYKAISSSAVFGALKDGDSLNLKAWYLSEMIYYFLGIEWITTSTGEQTPAGVSVTCYPNPFAGQITFEYDLQEKTHVALEIYTPEGRLISRPVNCVQDAGSYRVSWNADDHPGGAPDPGCYYYRLAAGKQLVVTDKIILIR
ncbi:MAG: T9SS type A sorting domain-containing protein [Bacteroidales bacterium]|nr:T9SS type A sorting domain-containing protein [Bacteroidales bacterium]